MDIESIKKWLKVNKKTQQWLADETCLDIATINKWLNGKMPLSASSQKLVGFITSISPESIYNPLTREELSIAAESIQRTPEGLIHGVLGFVNQSTVDTALNRSEAKHHG